VEEGLIKKVLREQLKKLRIFDANDWIILSLAKLLTQHRRKQKLSKAKHKETPKSIKEIKKNSNHKQYYNPCEFDLFQCKSFFTLDNHHH
jgi:hypothetical protein